MGDWTSFIREVEEKKKELGFNPGEKCYYRGHRNCEWPLMPSLFRYPPPETIPYPGIARKGEGREKSEKGDPFRALEFNLFFEFSTRAKELASIPVSDWDILFQMRHHAVPTRLLDWTEVLGIALFFAVQDAPSPANNENDPCIWLLNPYLLNEENWWNYRGLLLPKYLGSEWEKDDYDDYGDFLQNEWKWSWSNPVAISPVQKNARMHAQRAGFTIHGDRMGCLNKLNPNAVREVIMPPGAVEYAREFLSMAGIDDYLLFPDLDGLSKALTKSTRSISAG